MEDYYVDGCLYCGRCHTKKEFVGTILNMTIRVPTLCRCQAEQEEQIKRERLAYEEARRIQSQKATCIHDRSLLDATFENDDGSLPQLAGARRYVESWPEQKAKNHGLLLYGNIGVGKTFYAGCIANALIERNVPVLMTSFPKVLNQFTGLYSEDKNNFIADMMRYHLLIIDDFGLERNTEFAQEQVYSVIDERYKTKLPLIITTNKSLKELKNPESMMNARIYDRVLAMCVPVHFTGRSRRIAEAEKKYRETGDLFGFGKEEGNGSGGNNPENGSACNQGDKADGRGVEKGNAGIAADAEEGKNKGGSEGKDVNAAAEKAECSAVVD